jgi:UDP-3-O-[3-hydroxymyristoyl] N-acetylglucosamine deacetylase
MFAPFIKEGTGLHTGRASRVVVEMGLPDSGVVFLSDEEVIPASPEFVSASHQRATALEGKHHTVSTVEHLLAALLAFGETDVRVSVEGPEIPILDGSALPFAQALKEMGADPHPCFVAISEQVVTSYENSTAQILPIGPEGEPFIHLIVDFERPELKPQEFTYYPLRDSFLSCVAPARTFAFEADVKKILQAGLGKGGSLDCALIIGHNGPLNPEGMRFENEPARHKLLDAMGDLFLLGGLPFAEIHLEKPGHQLLHELTRQAKPHCSPFDVTFGIKK